MAFPERTLKHMDLEEHLDDSSKKQRYVTTMFDIIAPRYDAVTRAFSFGMDQGWKRELLEHLEAGAAPGAVAVDLASGTGDLAFAVSALLPEGQVLGIDVSIEMVKLAKRRAEREGIRNARFQVGDMTRLDLPDASVDLVTIGYGLRNVPDFRAALAEIGRVLKPGGRLANLDFARPENGLWRRLYLGYLSATGNLAGYLLHGEGPVYGYIARSIDKYVSWRELSEAMEAQGLQVVAARPKLMDGICLHLAQKR